jgi:tripartite-type tricarboxylate transporter receptor subunit TctC
LRRSPPLNAAIDAGLRTPEVQETLSKIGAAALPGTPEEFAATIAAQFAKWRAFGREANIKID